MASIYYHTVGGRIRGQTGATRRDYLSDALGSVTATTNESAQVENTYRAKPYGAFLAKTGSAVDPRYLWTGKLGSRYTAQPYAEQYNRKRHLATLLGRWVNVDPLRLLALLKPFRYARANPIRYADPSGLFAVILPGGGGGGLPLLPCTLDCSKPTNDAIYDYCYRCWKIPDAGCIQVCNGAANWYYTHCPKPGKPSRQQEPADVWHPGPVGIAPLPRPRWWQMPPNVDPTIQPSPPRPVPSNRNDPGNCWRDYSSLPSCIECCRSFSAGCPWWNPDCWPPAASCIDACKAKHGGEEIEPPENQHPAPGSPEEGGPLEGADELGRGVELWELFAER